jgi:holo-[acyl-carrier protein] synthase
VTGIGIDLLEIERLERALERRPQLASRLFTEGELAYAAARARPGQHLAARFCAKEAVAKALGLGGWAFREVEVVPTAAAPRVELRGEVARLAGGREVAISLTHTRTTAGAVALVEGGGEPPGAGALVEEGAEPPGAGALVEGGAEPPGADEPAAGGRASPG